MSRGLGDVYKRQVSVFGSPQLGKDKQGMQKLKLGTVNMWLPSSVMASIHDEFGVFAVSYTHLTLPTT